MPRTVSRSLALCLGLVAFTAASVLPAAAQSFGRNKIQYDGFDWHVLRTEHFEVYYYPEAEDLARIGAETAEEAYDELETRFDFSLTRPVPIVFYATNLHFKQTNTTPGFIPDGVGGFFEFLKGRVVIPADGNLHRFRRVIRHELVHVFTFNKLARVLRDHRERVDRVLPLWFTEGLAEYWSGEPDFQHEMILRDAVASNFFVPLSDFDRIRGTYVMYKEGEAFCRFVGEVYGEERVLALIENAWRSRDFSDVIEHVLGQSEQEVSDRWESWTREQYLPKVVGADVPSLVAAPVAARGFSAKPVVWTRPDGRREVIYMNNRGSYTTVTAQPVDADMRPSGRTRTVVRGERSEDFEAFHLFDSRMDVSPSGLLALVSKRGAADVVHLIDLASGRREAMLGFEDLVAIYSPTLSADGQRVAFTGIDRGGMSDLYLYDRPAQSLTRLTNDEYDDRDPDLSADGTRIVFSSDRTAASTAVAGDAQAYNLFTYDVPTHRVEYLTSGAQVDLSPRWSPDEDRVLFVSSRREADGKFSAQDIWLADLRSEPDAPVVADAPRGPAAAAPDADPVRPEAQLRQLTRLTSAAYDPFWADSETAVFTAFEDFRFTVRVLAVDSLALQPEARQTPAPVAAAEPWTYDRIETADGERGRPYRKRYQLDVAQGGISTSTATDFTAGGATVVFSDMLGDDRIFVTGFSANGVNSARSFLDGLNAAVTRVHLGRRANVGYGVFRLSGPRYDRTDPDAQSGIPSYEQVHGALGLVSYPLSFFQRIDLESSFGLGRKEVFAPDEFSAFDTLRTGLLANSVTLVHDNALYSRWGPTEGVRANLSAGYVADVLYSNENYYALSADVRHYLPLGSGVTFASWGLVRANVGRRARLNLLGGPWNLRGFDFLRVRGTKLWFTSQELRFPILNRPPLFPLFAGVRGAVFVDAAHNWTEGYNDVIPDAGFSNYPIGTTKGSLGAGVRTSLLGAFVLRYDLGWRFEDGFDWSERKPFGQFFFGYDF